VAARVGRGRMVRRARETEASMLLVGLLESGVIVVVVVVVVGGEVR
jgi:hypothetical protein